MMVFPSAEAYFARASQIVPDIVVHEFVTPDFTSSPSLGGTPPSTANFEYPDILSRGFARFSARSRNVARTRAWRYETCPLGCLLHRDIVKFFEFEDKVALTGKGTRFGLSAQEQHENGNKVKYGPLPLAHHVIL